MTMSPEQEGTPNTVIVNPTPMDGFDVDETSED